VNDKKVTEVELTTTVRSEAGMRVFTHQQVLRNEWGTQKFITHALTTPIPLKDFTPGQYVLTIEARGSNKDAYPATRQVPFSVK
jgi:hypothetical protein